MADNLPINFPLPSESAIASYSYTDLAKGTGYVRFYGGDYLDPTSTKAYSLVDSTFQAYTSYSTVTQGNTATYTFDIALNLPRTINGRCFFLIPTSVYNSGTSGNVTFSLTASLYKYNGSTETQIGATVNYSIVMTPSNTKYGVFSGYFESGGKVIFKKGETIRFKVAVTSVSGGNGSSSSGTIYHDPSGIYTTSGLSTSTLKLDIPFVINN